MNHQAPPNQMIDSPATQDFSRARSTQTKRKSRISPAFAGAVMGAIAGRFLPKLSPFSGAVLGIMSAKMYQKRQSQHR
ncbi:hypothetical protein [Acinetobacter sp. ANC 4178]|jgi:hypothetical protein|uniref:hypothetical protein n=1 Tax=Acinetobacter sp. ANC 4178 TaxID=2529839 RepID=UPI00103FB84F|nr:hypothetical protein [Acinetobacter sp. ANC 4178]TCB67869.1 hypothetical protein E0H87_06735 [Acinetobacter sp. ANC 4178]